MKPVDISSPSQLVDVIQSLVTGSFEKKFAHMRTDDVIAGFAFATQGLSQSELRQGLMTVLEMGFCPDAALFRRWCLGLKNFDNADAIADSYIGKSGALASILRWLETNGQTDITQAEKQAYDETYHLFNQLNFRATEQAQQTAHSAFKDAYQHRVNALVAQRIPCAPYQAPIAISQSHTDAPRTDIVADPAKLQEILAGVRKALAV